MNDLLPDVIRLLDAEPDPEALAKAGEYALAFPCMLALVSSASALCMHAGARGTCAAVSASISLSM